MSDWNQAVEAMARAIWNGNFDPDDVADGTAERCRKEWPREWRKAVSQATAAAIALRERLEPVGWAYFVKGKFHSFDSKPLPRSAEELGWTETPLYSLPEKPNDD